ncbi:DUF4176 domain-containing protein [Fructobacillus sp. M1-13]|uniref:DUF4176 domain-containing protein n=1 Tax=Fructobacillus papyriferae TaxID=2713171 RepID=A0ABS5QNZ0_9LACO|nr:DUF4176 domain-containing protein [Fructobacillus papyriferae]MBS9334785.1 DUF4176 domain-containing protein [Fructobacillus papyriferae]MCD2158775.1 DUF4176 domain-containing protein [Fructobacillus papyriferae]
MNKTEFYPVGTVLYLKQGTLKLVVFARGQLLENEEDELPTYYDYLGAIYPQDYETERLYYFNAEDVDSVVFEGYSDDDGQRYQAVLSE